MTVSPATAAVGAICRPQNAPERMLQCAIDADAAGLAELWLWEDCFLEGGLASAAAILGATQGITVGVGLVPMPLRNVAIAAMEIATVERMFPGRLRVAVGHGVQPWMAQVGAKAASPIGLAREYLVALRALLAGETVTVAGDYVRLDEVALGWPPERRFPILLGAIGPKSLAVAGECADGVLLDADLTVEGAAASIGACLEARRSAGIAAPFETVLYQRYYRGPDAEAELEREAKPGGVAAGLTAGAQEVAARVREMASVGVGTVVLMPSATEADPAGYLSHAALDVAPGVS